MYIYLNAYRRTSSNPLQEEASFVYFRTEETFVNLSKRSGDHFHC
jgi:hypothetical protein